MPQNSVNRFIVAHIHFRLGTEHSGQGRLWIEIDREHTIAVKTQIMREVKTGGGLGAPSLEIRDSHYLRCSPERLCGKNRSASAKLRNLLFGKQASQLVNLGERIGSMIISEPRRNWPFAFDRHCFQCGFRNSMSASRPRSS